MLRKHQFRVKIPLYLPTGIISDAKQNTKITNTVLTFFVLRICQ
jgi:hypothetical protein